MKSSTVALAVFADVCANMFAGGTAQASIASLRLYHGQAYLQGASGITDYESDFIARAVTTTPDELTSAVLTGPTGTIEQLNEVGPGNYTAVDVRPYSPTDPNHPFGTYTFNLNDAVGGPVSDSIDYTADAYPATPSVANYAALQKLDPGKAFDLKLTSGFALPAGADRGATQIFIYDGPNNYFSITVDPSQADFVIPAGTLPAREGLFVDVRFNAAVDGPTTPSGASTANIFTTDTFVGFTTVPETGGLSLGLAGLGLVVVARTRRR